MTIVARPDPGIMVIDDLLSEDDQKQLRAVFDSAELTAQALGRSSGSGMRHRGESRSPDVPRILWSQLATLLPPVPDWYPVSRPRPKLEPALDQWRWCGCNDFTRSTTTAWGASSVRTSTSRGARPHGAARC